MAEVLVIAPHPDDETLGCGGTILKHVAQGDFIHWLIVTRMYPEDGFPQARIKARAAEIKKVAGAYGFRSVHELEFPSTKLDTLPLARLIIATSNVFAEVEPDVVYLPYPGDVHSDHRVVFEAASACTKTFRREKLKRVLSYETLSETDFSMNPGCGHFRPNIFLNIEQYLDRKIEIMSFYQGELFNFPFPRSEQALRSLAAVRGIVAGCKAAESFMLLKEIG